MPMSSALLKRSKIQTSSFQCSENSCIMISIRQRQETFTKEGLCKPQTTLLTSDNQVMRPTQIQQNTTDFSRPNSITEVP